MQMNSTERLEWIAENNCKIVFEEGVPSGRLKRYFISIISQDGRVLELPRGDFDNLIASSFIKQDGPEDSEGRTTYRLTPDGRAFAKTGKAA